MRIKKGLPKIIVGSFYAGTEATGKNKVAGCVGCWDCLLLCYLMKKAHGMMMMTILMMRITVY